MFFCLEFAYASNATVRDRRALNLAALNVTNTTIGARKRNRTKSSQLFDSSPGDPHTILFGKPSQIRL